MCTKIAICTTLTKSRNAKNWYQWQYPIVSQLYFLKRKTERFLRVYWVLYSFYQIKFLTPFGKDSCKSSKDASISLALAFNLEILCWEKCQKNFVKVNNYIEWRKVKKSWLPHLYFGIFLWSTFCRKMKLSSSSFLSS